MAPKVKSPTHREVIKNWLDRIDLTNAKVIDWGSGSKPAFRYIHHQNCTFDTVDNAPGIPDDRKGTTHFNIDISKPIDTNIALIGYDAAFCLEVLEHVENPWQLMANIRPSLYVGGKLYLSAPFKYPVHAEADYWRFTQHGLQLLLEKNDFRVFSIKETIKEFGFIVEAVAI